jgi:hypothetical protein
VRIVSFYVGIGAGTAVVVGFSFDFDFGGVGEKKEQLDAGE